MWSGFVPQKNLDEDLELRTKFMSCFKQDLSFWTRGVCCVCGFCCIYMLVMCYCSSCVSVLVVSVMHWSVMCVVSVMFVLMLLPWTSGLRASWRGLNVLDSVTPTVVQQLQQLDQAT